MSRKRNMRSEPNMPNRSRPADHTTARLELSLTDLLAHFEAQLRTVRRAEECLLQCRDAQNTDTFRTAADGFRQQLKVIGENRQTIGILLGQIVDDSGKLHFAKSAARLDAPMSHRTRSKQD
jgi:hypothetical protein